MTVFPTWYTDKWSADATDKVWSSDWVTNFNLTVDEIGTEVFTDRDTDDLTEWTTNKYATTANVDAAWATMNTDTTLVGNGWFLDDDTMADDDATKTASQQSIKAYVDNFPIPSASETVEGSVERNTETEAIWFTDTTRYTSALHALSQMREVDAYNIDNDYIHTVFNNTIDFTDTLSSWTVASNILDTVISWGNNSWNHAKTSADFWTIKPTSQTKTQFFTRWQFWWAWTSTSWSWFIGMVNSTGFSTNITPTVTVNHFWFIQTDDGATFKVYASNANWTTQTLNEITGITENTTHSYRAVHSWSNIEYYVDWVLKFTHTTNLPSLTNVDIFMWEADVDTWTNQCIVRLYHPTHIIIE